MDDRKESEAPAQVTVSTGSGGGVDEKCHATQTVARLEGSKFIFVHIMVLFLRATTRLGHQNNEKRYPYVSPIRSFWHTHLSGTKFPPMMPRTHVFPVQISNTLPRVHRNLSISSLIPSGFVAEAWVRSQTRFVRHAPPPNLPW